MIRWTPQPPRPAGISPRIRPARRPLVVGLALLCLLLAASAAGAPSSRDRSLKELELMPGVPARVNAAGHLVFGPGADGWLKVEVAPPGDARRLRKHEDAAFGAIAYEGVAAGRRGFTDRADDDDDGLTDEDPLDGVDNDGDGRIDEDFAAVGDAMIAVHLADGPAGRPLHLEYYHWAQAHLRSAVFLAATGRPDLVDAGALRVTTGGEPWREISISGGGGTGPGHPARLAGRAWISRVENADAANPGIGCDPHFTLWLGVRSLDPGNGDPVEAEGRRLDVALAHGVTPLVFATAESRQQLLRILDQAVATRQGVVDPVTGQRTRWLPPPLCAACRQADFPAMTRRGGPGDGAVLVAARTEDHGGLPDPDLFVSGGRSLGAPDQIRWIPEDGDTRTVAWGCAAATQGGEAWTRLAVASGPGRIEYVFPHVDPQGLGDVLEGRFLDGRSVTMTLAPVVEVPAIGIGLTAGGDRPVEEAMAADRDRALREAARRPKLSPALLEGWPNPFRDRIQLKFTVPRTVEEAFVWDDPADVPSGLDLQAAVPWSGGNPRVSVKIYSINGQELVTLEATDLGVGEYTVAWGGTDAYGRQVASGTYFCKLQIDEWSVTRRLVFLR